MPRRRDPARADGPERGAPARAERDTVPVDPAEAMRSNTKFITEYIRSFPDWEDIIKDSARLAEEYEKFQAYEAVEAGVVQLYARHIEKELGIKLGKDGREKIEQFLIKGLREDPDFIFELQDDLETFTGLEQQIASKESALARQRPESALLEELEAIRATAGDIKELDKWFMSQHDRNVIRDRLDKEFGFVKESEWQKSHRKAALAELQEREQQILNELDARDASTDRADIRRLQGELKQKLEQQILVPLLEDAAIAEAVKKAATDRFKELFSGNAKGLASLEKAEEDYRKLVERANRLGQDIAPEEATINDLVQKRAEKEIASVLSLKITAKSYPALEKALAPYITKKRLGTMDEVETEAFIEGILKGWVQKLEARKDGSDATLLLLLNDYYD